MSLKKTRKILIVEDDEDFRLLYRLFLQGKSYHILQATNGKEALELVEREKPDLIILDMIMPVMDGEEFIQKLRFERQIFDIPIIVASVNDRIPAPLVEKGKVHSILKKPFPMEVLLHQVETALEESDRL